MKKLIYIIPLLLLCSILPAQEVAFSYETIQKNGDQATLQVYLQSLTKQEQSIRAINFSFAIPEGCVKITDQKAIFSDSWTDFLQEVQMTEQLDLNYNNWHYTQRWQYGSADPGMPGTSAVLIPAQGETPLQIMEIKLEGSCVDKVYLEQQLENPVNQMGDDNILPITWTVIHPKTDLTLQKGLKLEMYPNPVHDHLNLRFEGNREFAYQFELSTIDGKMIQKSMLETQGSDELRMDMGHLPTAVYILSISKVNGEVIPVESVKIIKK